MFKIFRYFSLNLFYNELCYNPGKLRFSILHVFFLNLKNLSGMLIDANNCLLHLFLLNKLIRHDWFARKTLAKLDHSGVLLLMEILFCIKRIAIELLKLRKIFYSEIIVSWIRQVRINAMKFLQYLFKTCSFIFKNAEIKNFFRCNA